MEHIEEGCSSHCCAITTTITTTTTSDIHHYQNCKDCKELAINNIQQDILPFSILPSELKAHILTYLPSNEIINFSSVSRSSYELIAPSLSGSINVADEYSIYIWIEIVNRLNVLSMKQVETLQDCKKLFLKTLLEQRSCRSCKKKTPNFKTLLKGEIVKSCRCDGYICRKSCWEDERLVDESIESCSKCGYEYQFTNNENTKTLAMHMSKNRIPYQLVLTAVTFISVLLFLYYFIVGFGDQTIVLNSKIWIKLEDIWYFEHLPMWKEFLNGMTLFSPLFYAFTVIFSIVGKICGSDTSVNDIVRLLEEDPMTVGEGMQIALCLCFFLYFPLFCWKEFKEMILRRAIYECPVKTLKKKDLHL